MRAWVKHSNMEEFSSLLSYTADKLTPTGSLCHCKDKADSKTLMMMPTTPLQQLCTMDASDYHQMILSLITLSMNTYWLSQTRGKFMKYTLSDGTESRPISNQKHNWSVSRNV